MIENKAIHFMKQISSPTVLKLVALFTAFVTLFFSYIFRLLIGIVTKNQWMSAIKSGIEGLKTVEPSFLNGLYSVVILTLVIVVLLPCAYLEITIGFVFGWWALLINPLGITLGSVISFLIGRSSLFSPLRKFFENSETLMIVSTVIGRKQLTYLVMARFAQIPIFIKNYGFAMIPHIKLLPFTLATYCVAVCVCPVWIYIGYIGRLALESSSDTSSDSGSVWIKAVAGAVGLVSLICMGGKAWLEIKAEAAKIRAEQAIGYELTIPFAEKQNLNVSLQESSTTAGGDDTTRSGIAAEYELHGSHESVRLRS